MKSIPVGITAALLLAAGTGWAADEFWLGLRGGPALPRLSSGGNEISEDYSSRLAPNFGVVAEYTLTSHLSLQLEVNYSGQGGIRDGVQPITQVPPGLPPLPPGSYLYGDFKNEAILDYLEVPVMLKWNHPLSEHWRCYVEGGLFFGYLLKAEQRTRGTSQIYVDKNRTPLTIGGMPLPPLSFDANTNVKDDINDFNWGVTAGLGIAYLMTPKHQIFFDLRGEYGLRTIQRDTDANGSSNVGAAIFTCGYMYNFGR
jgi:hypothetical protein